MIVVLLAFIGYQLYRIILSPTAGLITLTAFDAVIVVLTWREYGQQRRARATRAPHSEDRGGSQCCSDGPRSITVRPDFNPARQPVRCS
jgi:hypothetical protein